MISLQASSGGAWRSLAALIILPRFSVSSRSGMNSLMHLSPPPPPAPGGGPAGRCNPAPEIGAAPPVGNGLDGAPTDAVGAAPLTGGNGEALLLEAWPGSGAGNAPCAPA